MTGEIREIGKWIYGRQCAQPEGYKTARWAVVAKNGEIDLGEVKWFGKWRCYAYFPLNDTLYEMRCLREIADFCEKLTKEQRGPA